MQPIRKFSLIALWLLSASLGQAASRTFSWNGDVLAFENDTFWHYSVGPSGQMTIKSQEAPPPYTRHCLVMTRAVLQFYKFAEFAPRQAKLSPDQYRIRVRKLARIPVWSEKRERIVFPGFADLHSFSEAYSRMLQEELGIWWPTYFRVGNWRMALPFPRSQQKQYAEIVATRVAAGHPQAVFITRFKPLNHILIAFRASKDSRGNYQFHCYDPNNSKNPMVLRFDAQTSSFEWPKTKYWPGGRVNVFPIYQSWFR